MNYDIYEHVYNVFIVAQMYIRCKLSLLLLLFIENTYSIYNIKTLNNKLQNTIPVLKS